MEQKTNCIFGGNTKERKERIEKYISIVNKEKIYEDYPMDKYLRTSTDDIIIINLEGEENYLSIEKPNIETYMGTGYSNIGQGLSYKEAIELSNKKQKDPSYFINKNIDRSEIKRYLDHLKEAREGYTDLYIRNFAAKKPKETKIKYLMFLKPYDQRTEAHETYNLIKITDKNLIDQLIKDMKEH